MSKFVVVDFPEEAKAYEGALAFKSLHAEESLSQTSSRADAARPRRLRAGGIRQFLNTRIDARAQAIRHADIKAD